MTDSEQSGTGLTQKNKQAKNQERIEISGVSFLGIVSFSQDLRDKDLTSAGRGKEPNRTLSATVSGRRCDAGEEVDDGRRRWSPEF
jgi:hypothetical protein